MGQVAPALLLTASSAAALLALNAAASSTPAGSGMYTKAQAAAGARAYAASCARCHGAQLDGGMGPPLKGPLAPYHGVETVGDLYSYVSTQMPLGAPGSLKQTTYVAIVAYLLQRNGHAPGPRALSAAAAAHSSQHV